MSRKKNSSLLEIRDMLKEEMDKFEAINDELIDNQNDFEKINENYNQYNDLIDKGHSHITDLEKQEFYENLLVYISFYFFFGCVIYVLSKRFPIHRLILFCFKQVFKIIMLIFPNKKGTISSVDNVMNVTNTTYDNIMNETAINNTNITLPDNETDINYCLNNHTYLSFLNNINVTFYEFSNIMSVIDSTIIDNKVNNTNYTNSTFDINDNLKKSSIYNEINQINQTNSELKENEDT